MVNHTAVFVWPQQHVEMRRSRGNGRDALLVCWCGHRKVWGRNTGTGVHCKPRRCVRVTAGRCAGEMPVGNLKQETTRSRGYDVVTFSGGTSENGGEERTKIVD